MNLTHDELKSTRSTFSSYSFMIKIYALSYEININSVNITFLMHHGFTQMSEWKPSVLKLWNHL